MSPFSYTSSPASNTLTLLLAMWPAWVALTIAAGWWWLFERPTKLDRYEVEAARERLAPARGCLFGVAVGALFFAAVAVVVVAF